MAEIDDLDKEQREAQQREARGKNAQILLGNALFNEAFTSVKNKIKSEWENSPGTREGEITRSNAWISLKLINSIESAIRTHVDSGKIAKQDITDINERRSLLQRMRGE